MRPDKTQTMEVKWTNYYLQQKSLQVVSNLAPTISIRLCEIQFSSKVNTTFDHSMVEKFSKFGKR